ncbi:tRNA(1)(Val) (adenine(37)-N(6))-methyltransferase TrmN [Pantoea rwandensis]|uniref:tRNA1(Val) (adenine(37)-N6)-methyltransferase n=1 Tax=Pantoea rwandensis TaxID=1076550 RepID=A0A1X1CS57_9GAMM|nr:tRNA1(Val) (adenine(37)-N6)-methyltransferase [Pantoea rwandensis]ORM67181.1 tRNA (adenosine(37)-N6)-methyltransferase TrmM [Pantoea rwandensis]
MSQDQPQARAMLRKDGFTFKQFFVAHDRCAMKVGTDGVLIGAWAPVADTRRILDIGCGSGLIALMLAQRTPEHVTLDAVELEESAACQADENVRASPWADRITVHHQDVVSWSEECEKRYSLIVSNPPFFAPGTTTGSVERDNARSTGTLDHPTLLRCAAQLIEEEGIFCVVLPEEAGEQLISLALAEGWHLRYRFDVAAYAQRPPNRLVLGFSPTAGETLLERLAIRDEDKSYSADWLSLVKDFYLFR